MGAPRIFGRGSKAVALPQPPVKGPAPADHAVERCRVYVGGEVVQKDFDYLSALKYVRELGEGFVWLELCRPDEQQMIAIANAFDVHELIVEDTVSAHQRAKVERYDNQLFMVMRTVYYKEHEIAKDAKEIITTGEVQLVLGRDFIITIRHGKGGIPGLKSRELSEPEQVAVGPSGVAWIVADAVVDEYVRIAGLLATDVDELETAVFTPDLPFDIELIYLLKREILEMRHSIDPLAGALRTLTQVHKDMLAKEIRTYYRDVLDHELAAVDTVASHDERLSSLIDAGVAIISLQQNSDMRQISALVGMAAVPTMIAGIYGMNFDNMPELHTQNGYYVALIAMAVSVAVMFWFFKRNNWL